MLFHKQNIFQHWEVFLKIVLQYNTFYYTRIKEKKQVLPLHYNIFTDQLLSRNSLPLSVKTLIIPIRLVVQTATIILVGLRCTPVRTLTLCPIVDMATAWSRSSSTRGSRVKGGGSRGVLLWPTIDFQLGKYSVLDGGVAGVSRMEWTQPPAISWRVTPSSTWNAPSCDWLTIEGVLGFLSTWVTLGCLWARGPLAGDLPRVIEVPEIDSVEVSVGVDLIAVICAGLAESVAGEARVDVDVAHFGFIFVRLGSGLVKVVDFADMVVEILSQIYAKIWIFVG